MTEHVAPGMAPIPCLKERFGSCPTCELLDPASPRYREGYRRLFHPEEFPESPAPPPVPAPPAVAPRPDPSPDPVPRFASIPLAGDLVAAMTKRMGVDRFTRYVTEKLGVDCGCESRRVKLNELDAKFRKWLGW